MNKNIIVTIPAFNEGKRIYEVVKEIVDLGYTVVVVDDGSTDNTANEAFRGGAYVYQHVRNFGLAKTFQTEIDYCLYLGADIIVHIDSDGQYDATQIKYLTDEIERGYDLVLGSRFMGYIESMPLIKRMGNKMFTKVVSMISKRKITDSQTGFRAFTKEVAETINIESSFTYTQEQILKASRENFRIKEIPINFYKRGDNSRLMKGPLDYAWRGGINILRIFRDFEPLKFFGILGAIFLIVGLTMGGVLAYLYITLGHIYSKVPTAILSMLLIIIGIQIIVMGFLADMRR